jgi:O-antigen ligase
VHYQPVVDPIAHANPLDPLGAILFVATFILVAAGTARRPIFGLCALIALIPFAFYRDALGTTITLPKVALLGVLLGLTTYGGAFRTLRDIIARRFLFAGGIVLAATALSIAQATAIHPALRETLKAVEYPLFFLAAYVCYRLDPDPMLARAAIAATSGAVALLALAQEITGAPSGLCIGTLTVPRIAGVLEGPNQLAGYLEISIAVLAALTCARPQRITSLALALVVFADVLTFSRAGLAGAAIAIVVIALVYRRHALALAVPLAGGLAFGALVAGFWADAAHSIRIFRLSPATSSPCTGGVGTRFELWRAAIALWREHPMLGVGAGNFELDLPQAGLIGIRTHANSLYLQALVEGGVPLFIATLLLVWTSIFLFLKRAAAAPFIAGALAASIALALHQIFDLLVFYPKVGEWWWIVLALGAASLSVERSHAPAEAPACA